MCPESHLVKGSYNSYLCPWDSITSSNQTSGLWQREKGEKRTLQPCWLRGRLQLEENCSFCLQPAWDLGNIIHLLALLLERTLPFFFLFFFSSRVRAQTMTWSTKHAMSCDDAEPQTTRGLVFAFGKMQSTPNVCVCVHWYHTPTCAHKRNKMSLVMVFFRLLWLWHLKIFGNARAVCPGVVRRTVKPATPLFSILIANLIARDKIRCGV